MTKGFRLAGLLAVVLAIASCGDNNVHVNTGPGVAPSPGTFTGSLSDGGAIRIQVGSIEAIEFDCDNETISETFDPPKQVNSDGTFNVEFSDAGRKFRVDGTFHDNNTADGSINDADNRCDVTFDASRSGVVSTATPARTPTSVGPTPTPGPGATETVVEATSTPAEGETSTPGGGATSTPGGPTNTAGGPTATPTSKPGNACPSAVTVTGTSGDQKVLDTGWTGISHNQPVIQDSSLTFSLTSCASSTRPCGQCTVSGPIANPNAGHGQIDSQRCTNDTSIKCTDNTPCGSGTCQFFFGAPLPLSAGGVSTCITNQVDGPITGTANVEQGSFGSSIKLKSSVFLVSDVAQPCPLCVGDGPVNDGTAGGTCSGGTRNGMACDGNGTSGLFGVTSFDCPPALSTRAAALSIDFSGGSSTVTKTLSASSPNCTGAPGKKCLCPPGAGGTGTPTQPNACTDDTATPSVDESQCAPTGTPNKGKCLAQPVDQTCQHATYIGCSSNADCPQGDPCVVVPRGCYLDNGVVGQGVSAVGKPDAPVNGESDPTFAALFCVPLTGRSAIDTVAGLPGLGRIELPLHAKEIP